MEEEKNLIGLVALLQESSLSPFRVSSMTLSFFKTLKLTSILIRCSPIEIPHLLDHYSIIVTQCPLSTNNSLSILWFEVYPNSTHNCQYICTSRCFLSRTYWLFFSFFGVKMSPSSKAVFGSNVGSDKGIPLSSCLPLLSFVPSLSSPSPSSLKYYNWIIFSVQGFHWAQNCYFEDPNKPLVIFTVLPIVLTRGLSATNLWWCSF